MFVETIKAEILKHEIRMSEVRKNLKKVSEDLNREKNLSKTIILKVDNYSRELKVLWEYMTVLNVALEFYGKDTFESRLISIKESALYLDKACQKEMDKIYEKYPENEETEIEVISEEDEVCKDVNKLQDLIDKQELNKARYRIALFILRKYRDE